MDKEIIDRVKEISAEGKPAFMSWEDAENGVTFELLWPDMRLAMFLEVEEPTFYIIAKGSDGFMVSGNLSIIHSWRHDE